MSIHGGIRPVRKRQYLLMPVPPTPNGRLHLGHIAGPYLRMDVARRALERRGHEAHLITGTDPYDSFVLWKARQLGVSPESVCERFHTLIQKDLRAVDIEPSAFIDISSGAAREAHARHTQWALRQLVAQGHVETCRERVLFDPHDRRFIAGAWLTGECPQCSAACTGYFCESCGGHFRPEEMRNARDRLGSRRLETVEIESLFLKIADRRRLRGAYRALRLPEHIEAICDSNLAAQRDRFRLTVPGTWGVPWEPDPSGRPRTIFQAGWEFLTYGEAHGVLTGRPAQALSRSSDVLCVASFGIDNTIPLLVGAVAGPMALGAVRPVDHVLINHFYLLEGSKFSTSREHVLWAGDVASLAEGASDSLRYYLCGENPENGQADFRLAAYADASNVRLRRTLWRSVEAAWQCVAAQGHAATGPDEGLMDRCASALNRQDLALDFTSFSLAAAVRVLDEWIDLAQERAPFTSDRAYWWLKGLALLSYPVMPRLAASLWEMLGHSGAPRTDAFTDRAFVPPGDRQLRNPFGILSTDALRACMPRFAREKEVVR